MIAIVVLVIKNKPVIGPIVLLILQMIAIYLVNKELQSWILVFVQISMLFLMAEVLTDLRVSKISNKTIRSIIKNKWVIFCLYSIATTMGIVINMGKISS